MQLVRDPKHINGMMQALLNTSLVSVKQENNFFIHNFQPEEVDLYSYPMEERKNLRPT